jgi:agmatine deiminase
MRSLFFLAMALCAAVSFAQHTTLPHALDRAEVPLIPAYRDSRAGATRGISQPPAFPVRTMAEWEEVQALVITWTSFTGILKQIVRHAKEECQVIIVCSNPSQVTTYLQNAQYGGPITDLSNITFLQAGFNSIWMRDYGPETIYRNEVDTVMLLDWIYNRPRPADDVLSDAIASSLGIPIYSTTQAPYDLVHTGGNFMADGFGTAFSSNLVLDENGPNGDFNQTVRNAAGVDSMMHWFMGIAPGRYIKMPTLPYDGIHHIDMHMKLLDEERLLVGRFPTGQSDGPQIENNIQTVVANYNSVFGTPYEVIRIPMPPSTAGAFPPSSSYRTYTNNVFINGTVLVPTYRTEYDTTALRILREALPGYKVVGIDCDDSGQNIIQQSGAIHCITKAIGVAEPLLIKHQALDDTYDTVTPYTVNAYIRHRSGIAAANIFWTTDTAQGFSSVPMTHQGGNNWTGGIPAQPAGTDVFYYIEGEANSGKVQVRPIVAPAGWWKFRVLGVGTGVEELTTLAVDIYPNPTSSILVVDMGRDITGPVRVRLLDALGREAMRLHDGRLPADGRVFADIGALAEGAYLVEITGAGGRHVHRIAKR